MTKETQPTLEQLEATNKAYKLRQKMNDNELSKLLEISKVTLYTRLKRNNWTNQEILFIEYCFNPEFLEVVNDLKILNN